MIRIFLLSRAIAVASPLFMNQSILSFNFRNSFRLYHVTNLHIEIFTNRHQQNCTRSGQQVIEIEISSVITYHVFVILKDCLKYIVQLMNAFKSALLAIIQVISERENKENWLYVAHICLQKCTHFPIS